MADGKLDYWDFVSTQDRQDYTNREDFATLAKESLEFLNPYLDKMIWVEANIIYLNKVYDISQKLIGNYLNISQYGVSKRLNKAMERLKVKVKCPNNDYGAVRDELLLAFGERNISPAMCLYVFNNMTMAVAIEQEKLKDRIVAVIEAFINAKDNPIKYATIAHGLDTLNQAQLNINKEYKRIIENKDKIRNISLKYGDYFQMILDSTGIGEFVFNKQNRNKRWFD